MGQPVERLLDGQGSVDAYAATAPVAPENQGADTAVLKRIVLFVATNFAILFVLNLVLAALERAGVFGDGGLSRQYGPLMVMSVVMGFGGSFISLLLSKRIAKWTTGAQVIESPRNATEAWLVETVRRQAQAAGIGMPEVAVYDGPEMNAFATGATKNSSLVAVSTGLLQQMDRDEVEAVLGHEVSHIANGDMVTLTLLQGVLNTFVIFFSRIIGGLIDSALRRDEREGRGIGYYAVVIATELVLGIFATLIVMWFSRRREFRADRGGAALSGKPAMVNALRRLGGNEGSSLPESLAAFGVSGRGAVMGLFRSHPPIEDRIRALEELPSVSLNAGAHAR
ncbi:MAG TPA: protease HtpX [Polyangiaceae bacterium]